MTSPLDIFRDDAPPVILIVEDAPVNRELLRMRLLKLGYRIVTASNGEEAIAILSQNHDVDLILLDLIMPVMDGFAFLKWRNQNPDMSAIPVIVNSSLDDFESISQALEMDTYDYFTKPLAKQDLKIVLPLKIRNAITAKRLMAETKRQNEMMRRDLELAASYQQSLLPEHLDFKGLDITYYFHPCAKVGGDYFDCLALDDQTVGFIVADVSGHGVAAAMTASIIKALLPRYLKRSLSPAKALAKLNDDLLRLTQDDMFVTAFAAIHSSKDNKLTWALAGHPSPLYLKREGEITALEMQSIFLGVFNNRHPLIKLSDYSVEVKPGDRLFMYTDGLTEASNPQGEMYGAGRLEEFLLRHRDLDLENLKEKLKDQLDRYVSGEFIDDIAYILVGF